MQNQINHSAVARGAMAVVLMLSLLAGTSSAVSADNVGATSADNQSIDYALTDDSVEASVARLYYASFNREGETEGLAFWNNEVRNGRPLLEVADFFASSTEFMDSYGDLDNRAFVNRIYRNVLERAGDAEGVNYWTSQLDAGMRSRGGVVLGISDSAEFKARLLAEFDDSSVTRLYCAYFLRAAEPEGRAFWREQFANGTSLESISQFFAGSPEFNTRYGSLTNTQFVERIYLNVQDRLGEGTGKTFWINQLNSGSMNRGQVMLAFSESTEYKARFTSSGKCPTNTYSPPNTNTALLAAIGDLTLSFGDASDVGPTELDVMAAIDAGVSGDVSGVASVSAGSDANGANGESANGASLTANADGTLTYDPADGFSGTDTFQDKVCDLVDGTTNPDMTNCVTTTVEVEVADSNADVLAEADDLTINFSGASDVDATLLDIMGEIEDNTEGDASGIITLSAGSDVDGTNGESENGATLTIEADGSVTYDPADGFSGTDTFQVRVCDVVDGTNNPDTTNCVTTTVEVEVEDSSSGLLALIGELTLDAGDFVYETAGETDAGALIEASVELADPDALDNVILVSAGADLGASNGQTANGGTAVVNSATAMLTITPGDEFIGVDSVNLLVCDRLDANGEANLDACVTVEIELDIDHEDASTLECLPRIGELQVLGDSSLVAVDLSQGGCLTSFLDLLGADNLSLELLDLQVEVNGEPIDVEVDVDTNDGDNTLLWINIPQALTTSDQLSITADAELLGDTEALSTGLGLGILEILFGLLGSLDPADDAPVSRSLLDVDLTVGSDGLLDIDANSSGLIGNLVDPILEILI